MKKRRERPQSLVVLCGNHQFAPYSILCRHLATQPGQAWYAVGPVQDGREVEWDWVCKACAGVLQSGHAIPEQRLKPICVHCIANLQKAPGFTKVLPQGCSENDLD